MVVGHLLLGNQDLLAAVDYKVATLQQHWLLQNLQDMEHTFK